jgi:hypothetical protein
MSSLREFSMAVMKKISNPYTFSFKVFPYFYFGFIAIFVALVFMGGGWQKEPGFLVVPCVMAVAGWVFMKVALNDLVDEVYDCGDHLVVRKRGEEEKIPLSEIINVNFAMTQQPARITLTLARPGKFGPAISFALPPKIYLSPLPRSEIAEDLIARVHAVRSRRPSPGSAGIRGAS